MSKYTDIGVEKHGHVGLIEIRKPPLNFFDVSLINQIADALEEFDKDIEIRASVLAAQGKAFCAGADFSDPKRQEQEAAARKSDPAANLPINHLYVQAVRIFRNKKPIVAAVHGAAIGGGLGPCGIGGFPRHLPRGALRRQLHQARLPSRLRPDRDASRTGRQEQCGTDFLHQPPRHRRGSHQAWASPISACRRTRCAPRR